MKIDKGEWEKRKLGEVFEIASGGTPSRQCKEYYEDGNIPWIKTGDLKNKYIGELSDVEFITDIALKKSSAKLFPKKTVLIAMYGATIGASSILDFNASTNQACCAFMPNDNILSEFLYYYFLANKKHIVALGVGGGQPNVSAKILKELIMPLPQNYKEQQYVVKTLDTVSDIINLHKKSIEELDKLIQSTFYDMFGDPVSNDMGWEVEKLGVICDVRDGTHDSPKYIENGYPLITSKNIIDGKIDFTNVNFISKEDMEKINKRSLVSIGDIIMPMIGTIGNPVILDIEEEFSVKNVAIIKFTNDNIKNIYVKIILSTSLFTYFVNKSNRGGTQKFISLSDIRSLEIPIPPIPLQEKFANIVNHIEEQKAQVNKALEDSQMLFDSLMQEYFE